MFVPTSLPFLPLAISSTSYALYCTSLIQQKWNEKFFAESYEAFLNGRSDTDPSIGWYEGEMGFFDYYIIPLAKKLKDCEVFGVGADEYLNYAKANRAEWETKGRDIVTGYLNRAKRKITAAAAADPGVV
uniref:Uncharacterized protein n=1 Tax=Craspedostauros australis TaxID=1486917 RepID=A0A7R9ZPR5_9STRA|mmetsp:Transcript_2711/g.7536  ORF Transcript_2711/g.7536 Transcript_2711/m.7536 type:complete len:130 (+) Transcript_2711:165-554(+)